MRIGLLRKQQPFAEFDPITQRWRVWYIYNNDVTSGTYYDLYNDGTCDRVTVADRDVVNISRVADPKVDTSPVELDERIEEMARRATYDDIYCL